MISDNGHGSRSNLVPETIDRQDNRGDAAYVITDTLPGHLVIGHMLES